MASIDWSTRWRHQMETFSALLTLCEGNSLVTGEFSSQRPVTRSFDVFFDLPLNKQLSKQSWGWWFETPWRSLWPHCNVPFDAVGIWCHEDVCGLQSIFDEKRFGCLIYVTDEHYFNRISKLEKRGNLDVRRTNSQNRADIRLRITVKFPDGKVHGDNMGPIWGRQDPGGPHDGPMNFAIWELLRSDSVSRAIRLSQCQ